MPHKLPDNAEPVGLDVFLHSATDVPNGVADLGLFNRFIERRLGHFQQLLTLRRNRIAYSDGYRGVTVISVEHHTAINRNNISGFEDPFG